jgi:RNA polymerase sigma-70 factor (ECF subfamily)
MQNSCILTIPVSEPQQITTILRRLADGDKAAEAELVPQVYSALHRLALQYLRRERPGHTLQATELVNEAYIRLVGNRKPDWQGRQHFFAAAAHAMRLILTDYARKRRADKRGGGIRHVTLIDELQVSDEQCELAADLDDALHRLAVIDPDAARVVELRFYAGLTEEEIGELMGISSRTVKRHWQFARAWLLGKMS